MLRSDDEALTLCDPVDVRERNRAKRPFSRSTDSGSDSTHRCFGKDRCRGRASKSSGGVDTRRDFEILEGREVATVGTF